MKTEALRVAVEKVKPGVASREIVEGSDQIAFTDGRVFSFNDELALSSPVEGLPKDFKGAVSGQHLADFLSKSKEDTLEIEVDGGEVVFVGKKAEAALKLVEEIKIPIDNIRMPKKVEALPKDFAEAIKTCSYSVSGDMTRPAFTGIHLRPHLAESFDNYRLTQFTYGKKVGFPDSGLLIPGSAAVQLPGYGVKEYGHDDSWVHFRGEDGTTFSCRRIHETFPDLDRLVKGLGKGASIPIPEELGEALSRAGVFAESDFAHDTLVTIKIKDGVMILRGEGDYGWYKERIPCPAKGEPITFSINPHFLSEVQGVNKNMMVTDKAVIIRGSSFLHVIALQVAE